MSDVKVIRLSTGEDVIAKVDEGSEKVGIDMGPKNTISTILEMKQNYFGPSSIQPITLKSSKKLIQN